MVVLATWLPVFLMGIAGLQTIMWWKETGEGNFRYGLLMIGLCVGFLCIARLLNGVELAKAMETWISFFDKILSFRLRLRARIRAINIQTAREERLHRELFVKEVNAMIDSRVLKILKEVF